MRSKTTNTTTTHANIMNFNLCLNLFLTKFKSNLIWLYSSHDLCESEFPYTTHVFYIISLSTLPGIGEANQNTTVRLRTQNFLYVLVQYASYHVHTKFVWRANKSCAIKNARNFQHSMCVKTCLTYVFLPVVWKGVLAHCCGSIPSKYPGWSLRPLPP